MLKINLLNLFSGWNRGGVKEGSMVIKENDDEDKKKPNKQRHEKKYAILMVVFLFANKRQ